MLTIKENKKIILENMERKVVYSTFKVGSFSTDVTDEQKLGFNHISKFQLFWDLIQLV